MKIDQDTTLGFIWTLLFFRFGVPRALVMDNEKHINIEKIRNLCSQYQTSIRYASVAYPMTNGQTEVTNRTIIQHLKKRLEVLKGAWADELTVVLWSYKTTLRRAMGESLFRLAFGVEVVVPVDIGASSHRVQSYI